MADMLFAPTSEIWKPVVGDEGIYEVSSFGRVRSVPRGGRRSVVLRPSIDKKGYARVDLRGSTKKVHRLVLTAFDRPANPGEEGAHLDGNPSNNCRENLAWKTSSENKDDQRRHGTMPRGEQRARSALSDDDVRQIRRFRSEGLMWKEIHRDYPNIGWSTLVQAGTGINYGHICDVPPVVGRVRRRSADYAPGAGLDGPV